jgi:hypothetical protein
MSPDMKRVSAASVACVLACRMEHAVLHGSVASWYIYPAACPAASVYGLRL